MILYCDTSALVKLYIDEPGSQQVRDVALAAEALATCRITWAEAHAAFSRHAREVPDDLAGIEAAKQALAADWPRYVVLEVGQALVERAGEYADAFALRGYDSVQLAAATLLAEQTGLACTFACFDARLNKAARVLGITVLDTA